MDRNCHVGAAMLILCSISPKLDPSLTQTAAMVFGP
jgi:hypothetical protein